MSDRERAESLLRELYAARVAGDLDRMCKLFRDDVRFKITGCSEGKPIAIRAASGAEVRQWLALMLKTFRLSGFEIRAMVVEGSQASVHWQADISSRITGSTIPTELVDVVQLAEGRIAGFLEFFAPR